MDRKYLLQCMIKDMEEKLIKRVEIKNLSYQDTEDSRVFDFTFHHNNEFYVVAGKYNNYIYELQIKTTKGREHPIRLQGEFDHRYY